MDDNAVPFFPDEYFPTERHSQLLLNNIVMDP
jgi:hypothetical protein